MGHGLVLEHGPGAPEMSVGMTVSQLETAPELEIVVVEFSDPELPSARQFLELRAAVPLDWG